MHFDFPVEKIRFFITKHGSADVQLVFNRKPTEGYEIFGQDIKQTNQVELILTKDHPADHESYATIDRIEINGFDFTENFKSLSYVVDKSAHPEADTEIPNNLYLGYIGSLQFQITQRNDLLTKAAWTLANNEFEYVKLPLKGENYREKNLHNILRDTRFMFTGSLAPNTTEIVTAINLMNLKDLRLPLKSSDRFRIENWINRSDRIRFDNFDQMPNFTYSNGIVDCLNSFISDTDVVYLPTKAYYFYREILSDKEVKIKDLMKDPIRENSKVVLELPSPWYRTEMLHEKIKEAKDMNCEIALDLTWLPISNDKIYLNLEDVDQIFFSMNKTWPIQDFRPAFRWSKTRINDQQTFQWDHCTYPKIAANVFLNLMGSFELDYVFEKYKPIADQIMDHFNLRGTSVLWFTLHEDIKHDIENPIWPYYFLDDFVCLRKLLDYHGKYFW